jgi:4-hydroxybenzoyl-CoA thioesterase
LSGGSTFAYTHRVRLEEVDAAGIVFFAHYFRFCHDAMAALLEGLEGGYRGLIIDRRLGLPAVHAEADFAAPLRFGDDARIAVVVERLGTSSVSLRFQLERASDALHVATVRHVLVMSDLVALRSVPLTEDLRALLEQHTAS